MQVAGGALLDGKLEQYERAWQAAGGSDISVESLGGLFAKLGQPLDAERLADIEKQLQLARPGKIDFPQFLEMFRADLLDLREILAFLQMGKSPDGLVSRPEVQAVPMISAELCIVSQGIVGSCSDTDDIHADLDRPNKGRSHS